MTISALTLKLQMAEGFFLMLSTMDSATDEEVGEAEIRMIEAHRALMAAHRA